MSSYIPESVIDEVEELKELWKFEDAMKIINGFLTQNPSNEDALLQVADIQYRSGEISKATKAIDFLNAQKNNEDPLGLYIKGVLEMEKNHWMDAKKYLQQALDLTEGQNHEIVRCYGLCEYWYGNREKWLNLLEEAFAMHTMDAELVYNLIELYMLEHKFNQAKKMIDFFYKNHSDLETLDKTIDFYDHKVILFDRYLKAQEMFD